MTDPTAEQMMQMDIQTLGRVREHGYTMVGVFDPDSAAQSSMFTYTAGMCTHGLRDLIVVGLPPDPAAALLSYAAEQAMKTGRDFEPGAHRDFLTGKFDAWAIEVTDPLADPYVMSLARRFSAAWNQVDDAGWDTHTIRATQIVWPRQDDTWPWDGNESFAAAQPLLGERRG